MTPCQHCGQPHPPGTPNCPRTGDSMSQPGPIGMRLDRYQVESLLGTGGFGSVYKARHVHTDALVALKVLKKHLGADPGMVERFLREARAAAAVGSDHIVRVLDAGQSTEGTPFLVLELLEGVDLKDLATNEAPLPAMRVVLLCLQVLDGLEAAHKKGIVHRDMKPANAFVVRKVDDRGTDKDFVKLLDFGISKMHAESGTSGLTMTGVAMGTPSYMAPEQFFDARSVDARADVYSVAVMMYELLSGRLPLDASSYAELIVKVRTESPLPLLQVAPSVPRALADAVMVGLAKEKEQRWGSAKEFNHALRAAMGLPLPGSTPIPPRATLGGQKVPPAVSNPDSQSMMLGSTAQPQRATPMPAPSGPSAQPMKPVAAPTPAPAPRQPTPAAAQGWVVPTGPGGQNQPLPVSTPAVVQPMPQMMPVAQAPYTQPPPSGGSSALKWVAIIGGGLIGLCCMCLGVGSMSDSFQTSKNDVVPPSSDSIVTDDIVPPLDPVPVDEAPSVADTLDRLEKLKVKKAPKPDAPVDPNGTEIFDSLQLNQGGPEQPTAEQLDMASQMLEAMANGASGPDKKKLRRAAERLSKLRQAWKSKGKLNERQLEELERIGDEIDTTNDAQP
ncbi:MAG: protein kinase [Myxococcales bacterium]|nr:protein kinase [Myxococcales bacterium]